jgi:metal-responsive CopG/Arc/MetJ family transcriptional regulator
MIPGLLGAPAGVDVGLVTCPHELAAEVDRYRRAQPEIPSESRAFAELIKLGLERWKEEQRQKNEKK